MKVFPQIKMPVGPEHAVRLEGGLDPVEAIVWRTGPWMFAALWDGHRYDVQLRRNGVLECPDEYRAIFAVKLALEGLSVDASRDEIAMARGYHPRRYPAFSCPVCSRTATLATRPDGGAEFACVCQSRPALRRAGHRQRSLIAA
jgi:hypothetical protein